MKRLNTLTATLPKQLAALVHTELEDWEANDKVRRLWARDPSLWTGSDEDHWLGWLDSAESQSAHVPDLTDLAEDIKRAGFKHALLLGMGGSSLCPEVLKMTFGRVDGFPELLVLDSTDPAQIRVFDHKIDVANTIFIVSSKSGSTLEPLIFKQYFFDRVKRIVGAEKAGQRFIAITDPGSHLQQVAERDNFRSIFMVRLSNTNPNYGLAVLF